MKQVIKFKSPSEHYKADACVVWCFDDRFTGLLGELNKFGFKNIDLIKVAGGAMGLTGRGISENFKFISDQVEKSIKLHHTTLIVLMVHKDCGAYKAFGLPAKGVNEKEFLQDDLISAKKYLLEYLEKKGHKSVIKTYIADFNGLWEVE